MSKMCGAANACPFSQQQTTGGCPCAELCPGFCEKADVAYSSASAEHDDETLIGGFSNAQESKT